MGQVEKLYYSRIEKTIKSVWCENLSGNNMFGVTKYDKDRAFFRCINFLAKADPKTPMIKVMPYIEVLNKVVFNKKYMNLRLKKEIK